VGKVVKTCGAAGKLLNLSLEEWKDLPQSLQKIFIKRRFAQSNSSYDPQQLRQYWFCTGKQL